MRFFTAGAREVLKRLLGDIIGLLPWQHPDRDLLLKAGLKFTGISHFCAEFFVLFVKRSNEDESIEKGLQKFLKKARRSYSCLKRNNDLIVWCGLVSCNTKWCLRLKANNKVECIYSGKC